MENYRKIMSAGVLMEREFEKVSLGGFSKPNQPSQRGELRPSLQEGGDPSRPGDHSEGVLDLIDSPYCFFCEFFSGGKACALPYLRPRLRYARAA